MKDTTVIFEPHFGQAIGSDSYTRLMSMAHVLLQRARLAVGELLGFDDSADSDSASALFRKPRLLLEYQP